MEPVTILGVVSAVITFLDFASKILKFSKEIKDSVDGHTTTNLDALQSLTRLDGLCDDISVQNNALVGPLSRHETAIKRIAEKCADAGDKLKTLLSSITARQRGSLANIKSSAKAVMKESKIRQMRAEIQNLNQELNLNLTLAIDMKSSSIVRLFEDVMKTQQQLQVANSDELRECYEDLRNTIKEANEKQMSRLEEMQILRDEVNKVDRKMEQAKELHSLLRGLSFPTMDDRKRQIKNAHRLTFDWIFQDEDEGGLFLKKWLVSSLSDIYWIKGKPGSGKSTLMKYISRHPTTLTLLREWSADKELAVASFFFWRAGATALEKSSEGLLRSLLFEMLRQCPTLLPVVMKSNAEYQTAQAFGSQQWTVPGLTKIFEDISQTEDVKTAFCFFIDGLDEYKGEPRELAKAILALASLTNVKICVASRSWSAFEAAFSENEHLVLELHKHTHSDIELFVTEVLGDDNLFISLSSDEPAYHSVIETIVEKAEGVFLWVALVVRELSNTLPYADTAETMLERLENIPSDLNEYFWYMLRNIPAFYRKDSCQILLMHLEEKHIPSLYAAYLSLDSTPPEKKATRCPQHRLEGEATIIKKRIQIRTQDLMEIKIDSNMDIWSHDCKIQFIHRTVHDFLLNEDVYAALRKGIGTQFNANTTLCNAYISCLRTFQYIPTVSNNQNMQNAIRIVNRFAHIARRIEQEQDGCDLQLCHIAQQSMNEIANTVIPGFGWHCPPISNALSPLMLKCQTSSKKNGQPFLSRDRKYSVSRDAEYFLPFAIRSGLCSYVSSTVREPQSPAKAYLVKHFINQLSLFVALSENFDDYEFVECSDRSLVYPIYHRLYEPMVRLLLELGANLDNLLAGDTAWEIFMTAILSHGLLFEHVAFTSRCCKVMRTMIEYGADCTLRFNFLRHAAFQDVAEVDSMVDVLSVGMVLAAHINLKSEEDFFSEMRRKAEAQNVSKGLENFPWSSNAKIITIF